jgi:hypothetical protein
VIYNDPVPQGGIRRRRKSLSDSEVESFSSHLNQPPTQIDRFRAYRRRTGPCLVPWIAVSTVHLFIVCISIFTADDARLNACPIVLWHLRAIWRCWMVANSQSLNLARVIANFPRPLIFQPRRARYASPFPSDFAHKSKHSTVRANSRKKTTLLVLSVVSEY